jgi:pyruvate dehydrogenase E2 component (dihydrolipoamide acetyltransferase)
MVKAAAVALKEQPIMNSSVVGDEIVMWEDVNIGVAVALSGKEGRVASSPPAGHETFELIPPQSADREHGLVVPVVYGADGLSVVEICRRIEELAEKARRKTLTIEEVSNSTFTVTNIGWYGDEYGTPIINPPEVAVIGIGVIGQKPVAVEGEVVVRTIMPVSLTVDHRVIDGATGGEFFKRVRELLENPGLLLAVS